MTDLIKREDAIKAMEKLIKAEGTMDYTEWDFATSYKQERINQTEACIDQIRYIPAVEPKRGKWICHEGKWIDFDYYPTKYECDQCHHYVDVASDKNFCPNCGARMFAKDINVPNKKGADDE